MFVAISSDNSIHNYATKIWKLEKCRRDGPMPVDVSAVDQSLAVIAASVENENNKVHVSKERYGNAF